MLPAVAVALTFFLRASFYISPPFVFQESSFWQGTQPHWAFSVDPLCGHKLKKKVYAQFSLAWVFPVIRACVPVNATLLECHSCSLKMWYSGHVNLISKLGINTFKEGTVIAN